MSSASRTPAAPPAIPRGVGTTPTLLVAGFVLLLTLGVTWLAWERVGAHDALAIRADFDYRARDVEKRISQRMNAHVQVLRGAAGLFTGSREVSRTDFRGYVAALRLQEHHPGIQGVGFALLVPASDLARHTSAVQREGFPGYAIRPPGPRDPYTSIVFLEPFEGRNLRAFGYDMFSEPVRREAMERALADGSAALSGKVTLVQETDAEVQAGVLLYLPVFRSGPTEPSVAERRERLLGWVYIPFRMNDLAVGVLGERGPELATAIYDGDGATSAGLLFDSEKANGGRTPALDHLEARRTFLATGRPWTLVVQSLPPFHERLSRHTRQVVAFGGIALSLLLTGLAWVLASGRDRALRLARGMNVELLEASAVLEESETRLQLALRGGDLGLWDWDVPSGRVTYNERWAEMLGYSLGEIEPNVSSWERLVHPDDASRVREILEAHLRGESSSYAAEHRLRHKDGHWVWVLDRGLVFDRNPDGTALRAAGTHLDISDRKLAEEALAALQTQLALTSRLAALGTLVAGVAHEINNPLAAALSDQDLALRGVRELRDRLRGSGLLDLKAEVRHLDEVVEELDAAQEAGRRIERIVRDLKVFGRPNQKDSRERVRLIDLVDLTMRWLPGAINQTATVAVEDGGAPDVVATAGQVTQVVVNLVTNASKATPEGTRGAILIRIGPGNPGMACLEVIDHGKGIEPAVLPHIFEPFFTTGDVGKGTGLGLAICHAIVAGHGGRLTVESEVGKGSTFRVELPAVPA
jgi:PAS domain S-box-containing protein